MDPDVDTIRADRDEDMRARLDRMITQNRPALDRLAISEQEDMITANSAALPPLPPYGQECCAKCDGDETEVTWVAADDRPISNLANDPLYRRWHTNTINPIVIYPPDWLVQKCTTCGFTWDELPMDHAADME
jgi:hypothetical protein